MSYLRLGGFCLLTLTLACERPVDRPVGGDTVMTDVRVEPQFIRRDRPIVLHVSYLGRPPAEIRYALNDETFPCESMEERTPGTITCIHSGVDPNVPQGNLPIVVTTVDGDGNTASRSTTIQVDFDCPSIWSAELTPKVARPGDLVTLTLETSEPLDSAPRVSWAGERFGTAVGSGTSWSITKLIGDDDPAQLEDIVAHVTDRAGNDTTECGLETRIAFGVDKSPPSIDGRSVTVERGPPGGDTSISAPAGSFTDDVAVARVRLHDNAGQLIAVVEPESDGSLGATRLNGLTPSRLWLIAVDVAGRESDPARVFERWAVSHGNGATPGSAIRSAVRYSASPPDTTSMRLRTTELAPDVLAPDARSIVLRAHVGFEEVGKLPPRYEGAHQLASGYDPQGQAVVIAGGFKGPEFLLYEHMSDVSILRWDEREGRYLTERGPSLNSEDPTRPDTRYTRDIAFGPDGCGVMIGGDVLHRNAQGNLRTDLYGDVWQICSTPFGYEWSEVNVEPTVDGLCTTTISPTVWDPVREHFVVAGGGTSLCGETRVKFLKPPTSGNGAWTWSRLGTLPSAFDDRYEHFLFYDHRLDGFSMGLGFTGSGQPTVSDMWTYVDGQWTRTQAPGYFFSFLGRTGYAFDSARGKLVSWGGGVDPRFDAEPEVRYLTETATNGAAWRRTILDAPRARDYPKLVYDSDREVVLAYGGIRLVDEFPIEPTVHQLISEPSYPTLQVVADLVAARPEGIARLVLEIRAAGHGDADGLGPADAIGGGYDVMLWDTSVQDWVRAHGQEHSALDGLTEANVEITMNPGRFVSPNGTVAVTLRPMSPTTEALDGRLAVDVVRGWLELSP